MKNPLIILAALCIGFLASCSDNDRFRVNGTIEGKPTMNLRASYYADGAYRSVITAVRNGEFEFFASASQPALLEITDYDYHSLGRLLVQNGNTYNISIDPADPRAVKASGSEPNERWSAFLRDNKTDLDADANSTVARYIHANPADIVSTLLLLTEYDSTINPVEADSLLRVIDPKAQPASLTEGYNFMLQRLVSERAFAPVMPFGYFDGADSLKTYNPRDSHLSIIALSNASAPRADSIVPMLRELRRLHKKSELAVLDISLDPDTISWRSSTRADSARWTQAWATGGIAAPAVSSLGIPATPYFIVCDSVGTQIYRGPSAAGARAAVDSLVRK